jgi:hypothetical protein
MHLPCPLVRHQLANQDSKRHSTFEYHNVTFGICKDDIEVITLCSDSPGQCISPGVRMGPWQDTLLLRTPCDRSGLTCTRRSSTGTPDLQAGIAALLRT